MIFSDIYDELHTVVAGVFSDHKELDDNVVIENNNELKLALGYAIEFQGADRFDAALACIMSAKQKVIITNTIANRGHELDLAARKVAEKALLENCYKLVKEIENNSQLNDKCEAILFENHNGIELIIGEDEKTFLMCQASYNITWFKNKET